MGGDLGSALQPYPEERRCRGRKAKDRGGATHGARTRTSSLGSCDAAITSVLHMPPSKRHGGFRACPLAQAILRPALASLTLGCRGWNRTNVHRLMRPGWSLSSYSAIDAVCPAVKRLFRFAKGGIDENMSHYALPRWQRQLDLNQRIQESNSCALPLGDAATLLQHPELFMVAGKDYLLRTVDSRSQQLLPCIPRVVKP